MVLRQVLRPRSVLRTTSLQTRHIEKILMATGREYPQVFLLFFAFESLKI